MPEPHSTTVSVTDFDSVDEGSNPSGVATCSAAVPTRPDPQDLFLIAHKVRGQPAFDIAVQMEMEDGVWWILNSTGHRAYPYWNCELRLVIDWPMMEIDGHGMVEMPDDLEDFSSYTIEKVTKEDRQAGLSLLNQLGLKVDRQHPSASGEIKRRI